MAALETIDPSRPNCPLLPSDDCHAVIAAAERHSACPSPERAALLARTMIGVYRVNDVRDPDVYVTALAATLAEFPAFIAERTASPVHGLPSRLKFLPAIAEVREALQAEDSRQRLMVARARWMIQERERRDAAQAERRAIEAQKIDPAKVDEILARFRTPDQKETAA